MKYVKPQVTVLGDATSIIEHLGSGKNSTVSNDGSGKINDPAYDLDE